MNPRYYWFDIYNRRYGSIENNFDGALNMLAYSIVTFSTPLTVFEGNMGDSFYLWSDAQPILANVQIFYNIINPYQKLKVVYLFFCK